MSVAGLTPDQQALRRQGITGTDIAKLANMSRYGGPMDVWLRLKGLNEQGPMQAPAEWGLRVQRVVADKRLEDLNAESPGRYTLFEPGTLIHPRRSWALVTPDYFVCEQGQPVWDLEIKTATVRTIWRWGDGPADIPEEYLAQVHWQLEISDLPFAEVATLLGGSDFRVYRIERDREFEAALVDIAERFWTDHILADVPPNVDGSKASFVWLERKFPRSSGKMIEASEEVTDLVAMLRDFQTAKKAAEQGENLARAKLMETIGEAEGVIGEGWKATWRTVKASEYVVKRKEGRQLRLYFQKGEVDGSPAY